MVGLKIGLDIGTGSVIAAVVLTLIPELLRDTIVGDYRMLFYAIILISMMLFTSNKTLKDKFVGIFSKKKKGEVK